MAAPSMVVVDASVWTARLTAQDTFHLPASRWMAQQRAENTLLVSPSLMLAEVAGAISRRTGDSGLAEQALEALIQLPGVRLVEMENALVLAAGKLAAGLGLRGADAVYVAVAETLDLPLCTLDEDQAHRAANRIKIQRLEIANQ